MVHNTKTEEDETLGSELYKFTKLILKQLPDEPFMSKRPNNNTPFEDALAILVMSAINLYISANENAKKGKCSCDWYPC